MNTEYSYDNIEAMINAIQSNSELINNMVKTTKQNDKVISDKMISYANTKSVFSQQQINSYKDYIDNKEEVEFVLEAYKKELENIGGIKKISMQIYNDNSTFKGIHNIFNKINSMQIKIMEMLCAIIGRSNMLMAVI